MDSFCDGWNTLISCTTHVHGASRPQNCLVHSKGCVVQAP